MPVKRRQHKRRTVSAEVEAKAWRMMFRHGYDYLGDLGDIGIEIRCAEHTPENLELARRAWLRFGAEFLADHSRAERCWALQEFGDPRECR